MHAVAAAREALALAHARRFVRAMTAAARATDERLPYRAAVAVAATVLAVYVLTLAPTVTFWGRR